MYTVRLVGLHTDRNITYRTVTVRVYWTTFSRFRRWAGLKSGFPPLFSSYYVQSITLLNPEKSLIMANKFIQRGRRAGAHAPNSALDFKVSTKKKAKFCRTLIYSSCPSQNNETFPGCKRLNTKTTISSNSGTVLMLLLKFLHAS